jgi:hypothetical protein
VPKVITDPNDAFDVLKADIVDLRSEVIVLKVLTTHAIGLLVRRAQNPEKYFDEIRISSKNVISENITFDSGDPEGNQRLIQKALERHDQTFEELKRALGFRRGSAH